MSKTYKFLRLALVCVALLLGFSRLARADSIVAVNTSSAAAYATCKSYQNAFTNPQVSGTTLKAACGLIVNTVTTNNGWPGAWRFNKGTTANPGNDNWQYFGFSPSGCTVPLVANPAYDGDGTPAACYDPNAECAALKARESDPADVNMYNPIDNKRTFSYGTSCLGGCTWSCQGECKSASVNGLVKGVYGHFSFTGVSCPVVAESPAPAAPPSKTDNPVCIPAENGQSFCLRQDGKNCYAWGTSREVCWTPTETGQKTDGPYNQTRSPGTTPNAPTPPAGAGLNQVAGPTVVVTTTTNNNTTTSTTTTTTSTFITNNGTSAGTLDQGQAAGTSTNPASKNDGSTVSGGACGTAYTCDGSAVQCAVLEEQHKARCGMQVPGITGGTTCATNDSPVCSGSECNASTYLIVLQTYKARCEAAARTDGGGTVTYTGPSAAGIGNAVVAALGADGGVKGGAEDGTGDAAAAGHGLNHEIGADGLDQSGTGLPRSCPTPPSFTYMGKTYTLDLQWLCLHASLESYMFLLVVAVGCILFITRG